VIFFDEAWNICEGSVPAEREWEKLVLTSSGSPISVRNWDRTRCRLARIYTGKRGTSDRSQGAELPATERGVHKHQRQNVRFTSTSDRMQGSQVPATEHRVHKHQRQNAGFTSTSDRTQGSQVPATECVVHKYQRQNAGFINTYTNLRNQTNT